MAGQTLEIDELLHSQDMALWIAREWQQRSDDRRGWVKEKEELRNYVFATDTTKTTNSDLAWKNKTTLPKLCQIRDNLHANYIAALFPNDNWVKWEGADESEEEAEKREIIENYVSNKVRLSNFRNTVSQLVYDYIDYGNAFGKVEYVHETTEDEEGNVIDVYSGPKLYRISPLDIVFNPLANDFASSPKIVRYVKTIGELVQDAQDKPELGYLTDVIDDIRETRRRVSEIDSSDWAKTQAMSIDGFGSLQEYYGSNYVELLEFEGDIYNTETGELMRNQLITIADRRLIIRQTTIPSWMGKYSKFHVGWRLRPDNIYAMGPLDNLVGMQYRIDHLENLKADIFDLTAAPPLVIRGDVDEFEWGPFEEIFVGDDGSVEMLQVSPQALQADTQIAILEQKMEEFAGAPRQAMGVRTPGEKTAYEVQSLENAAGRIFQEKITNFEVNFVEPALNAFLEVGKRNLNGVDILRVMDDDYGAAAFIDITKEDITAKGRIRPIGARHFAATAQLVQNLSGSLQIAATIPGVMNHVSGKKLASLLFEEISGFSKFDLVRENISIEEQVETQRLMNQAQEDLQMEATTPVDSEEGDIPLA